MNEGSTTILPGTGDGGLTEIRAFLGSLTMGPNSQVLADNISDGEDGENNLKSCGVSTTSGDGQEVSPPDIETTDDSGLCDVEGP